jgi:hypothetical protein
MVCTPSLGNLGNVSLGVLYVTVAVTVFLAPAIVYACREKWTMVFGALCYVVRTLRQSAIRTRDDGAITVVVMR